MLRHALWKLFLKLVVDLFQCLMWWLWSRIYRIVKNCLNITVVIFLLRHNLLRSILELYLLVRLLMIVTIEILTIIFCILCQIILVIHFIYVTIHRIIFMLIKSLLPYQGKIMMIFTLLILILYLRLIIIPIIHDFHLYFLSNSILIDVSIKILIHRSLKSILFFLWMIFVLISIMILIVRSVWNLSFIILQYYPFIFFTFLVHFLMIRFQRFIIPLIVNLWHVHFTFLFIYFHLLCYLLSSECSLHSNFIILIPWSLLFILRLLNDFNRVKLCFRHYLFLFFDFERPL